MFLQIEITDNNCKTVEILSELNISNPYVTKIQTRFCDTDSLGHINNASYVSYLELARTYWQIDLDKKYKKNLSFEWILGTLKLKFVNEGFLSDILTIYMWVSKISKSLKTWDFCYAIFNQDEKLVLMAESTQIGYDYKNKSSMKIPQYILDDLITRNGESWNI